MTKPYKAISTTCIRLGRWPVNTSLQWLNKGSAEHNLEYLLLFVQHQYSKLLICLSTNGLNTSMLLNFLACFIQNVICSQCVHLHKICSQPYIMDSSALRTSLDLLILQVRVAKQQSSPHYWPIHRLTNQSAIRWLISVHILHLSYTPLTQLVTLHHYVWSIPTGFCQLVTDAEIVTFYSSPVNYISTCRKCNPVTIWYFEVCVPVLRCNHLTIHFAQTL